MEHGCHVSARWDIQKLTVRAHGRESLGNNRAEMLQMAFADCAEDGSEECRPIPSRRVSDLFRRPCQAQTSHQRAVCMHTNAAELDKEATLVRLSRLETWRWC